MRRIRIHLVIALAFALTCATAQGQNSSSPHLAWVNPKTSDAATQATFSKPVKAGVHPTQRFDVYVCRHAYTDGTFAGKVHWDAITRQMKCFSAHDGKEVQHKPGDYDELRSDAAEAAIWIPAVDLPGNQLAAFALPVGTATINGASNPATTYTCQATLTGKDGTGVHVGWFDGASRTCHISWGGRDLIYAQDVVLILASR